MPETKIFDNSFFAMETQCDVVFFGLENDFAENVFQQVKNEAIRLDEIFNRFNTDSQVSALNRAGKNSWVKVQDELWSALTICFDFYQMTNGAFDITVTPLISFWNENDGNSNVSEKKIDSVRKKCGFNNVEFDFENQRIQFKTDKIEFDFGAIEKGIVLESIKPLLQNNGVKNGIVSFGERSILALGNPPNGENWPLGIRNIFNENEFVHVFSTSNETVSTSGTILSKEEGMVKKLNQIISPASGFPVEGDKSVSVKSESAILGEFISTTWLILPENDREILSEQFKKIEIFEINYNGKEVAGTKLTIL